VSAGAWSSQLGSNFAISADVKPGGDVAAVEKAIDEELQRLLAEGPSAAELEQARTVVRAGFVRGIERIGGFGGKADVLAECSVYTGTPGCFRDSLRTLEAADVATVQAAGRKWLGKGDHTLVVVPGERIALEEEPAVTPAPFTLPPVDPKFSTVASNVERSGGPPVTAEFPGLKFPDLQRATLSNGTRVILAERHDVPVVQMSYLFDGGFAADKGRKLGTSSFAMGMLDEGAGELGALEFANAAEALGANLGSGASLDGGSAYLSALKENLDPSLALYAQMLRQPRFEQSEIDRVRASWLSGIAQEKARPNGAALRVLPPLLYGEGHAYAIPFSGTGTEDSIKSLTRDDLVAFHRDWVRPEGATLVVVGDTTLSEVVPLLEKHLGDWRGQGVRPATVAPTAVARPAQSRVFLIDQPGAVQANIFVGQLMPSTRDPGAVRLGVANDVIGGTFTARLNMNLREDKHWSYGARSMLNDAYGQRPWLAYAPVQIDKTAESIAEIEREVREYATGKAPPSGDELSKIKANEINRMPGSYETASAVMGTIGGLVRYDRPDDWIFRRKAEIESMTTSQVAEAATAIDPAALTWVVVGDLKQIEQPVRALNLGPVTILDADGRPVASAAGTSTGD
jgi:zinc protease